MDQGERELCPDGACIGLIGPDGRCKECGRPGPSAEAGAEAAAVEAAAAEEAVVEVAAAEASGAASALDDLEAQGGQDEPAFDHHVRELCSDDMCIGLLGPDGRCKECGTMSPRFGLDPRSRGLRSEEDIAEELEAHITEGDLSAAPEGFDSRELCPDGACIGVIGPDGRCKECGTALSST